MYGECAEHATVANKAASSARSAEDLFASCRLGKESGSAAWATCVDYLLAAADYGDFMQLAYDHLCLRNYGETRVWLLCNVTVTLATAVSAASYYPPRPLLGPQSLRGTWGCGARRPAQCRHLGSWAWQTTRRPVAGRDASGRVAAAMAKPVQQALRVPYRALLTTTSCD